jgi:hypothetical protein
MDTFAENPRAVVGGNSPPPVETAIDRAKPIAEELGRFLAENPVISTDDESRAAKDLRDRFLLALRSVDEERDAKVRPLNAEVKAINDDYHRLHNSDKKRPGIWDKEANHLWARMNKYALELEQKQKVAAEAARKAADEQARIARELEQLEIEAATEAASGVCDVDIARVTEEANEAFSDYRRLDWRADRLEASAAKTRITGGICNAVSLKDHETLTISDWRAAIEDIGLTDEMADAIVKGARAYRKEHHKLPRGIERITERGL